MEIVDLPGWKGVGTLADGSPPYVYHPCHTEREHEALELYAEGVEVAVEIGFGFGGSAVALLTGGVSKLFSVDIAHPTWIKSTVDNVKSRAEVDCWAIIHGSSVEAAWLYDTGPIGLLFIDGDHSYQGVVADFLSWYPKVKPGGIVMMHDVNNPKEPGCTRFYEECLKRLDLLTPLEIVDTLAVFKKVGK